jgi:hypothetical protein
MSAPSSPGQISRTGQPVALARDRRPTGPPQMGDPGSVGVLLMHSALLGKLRDRERRGCPAFVVLTALPLGGAVRTRFRTSMRLGLRRGTTRLRPQSCPTPVFEML